MASGAGDIGVVVQLGAGTYDDQLAGLWRAATDRRRDALGLARLAEEEVTPLAREGAFGVGVVEGSTLVAAAVAMTARADDGRSPRVTPGLIHISSVATLPDRWGQGLGRRAMLAILTHGKRLGFARAQLWTHTSDPGARHLYESLGFTCSSRTAVDANGEDIVHYVHDLVATPVPPRPASRLLCCDPDDRVLLLHWRDPFDGYELWEPPGGGIEEGESPSEAVVREWSEETGLPVPELVTDPVVVGRDLFWLGDRYVSDEFFYLGRAASADVPDVSGQTEVEQASYLGHAWVPWQRLGDLHRTDKPDVLSVLGRLAPAGPWATSSHDQGQALGCRT